MAGTELRLPECPAPVAAVLHRLPSYPASLALATALNVGLAPQLLPDVSEHLRGKRFRLGVRDARIQLDFTWDGRRFRPLPRQSAVDLAITASGPDFLRLAQRAVDADTLFFDRRLSMEGDTELGLVVKNTLDALESPLVHVGRLRRGRP